jgi:hypothetical protein
VWALRKPCSLYRIATIDTEIVDGTAGKYVYPVPMELRKDCRQWCLASLSLLAYGTRRNDTAKEEAARFGEAKPADDEEIRS